MKSLLLSLILIVSSLFAFAQNIALAPNGCVKVYPSLVNDTTVTLLEKDSYTEEVYPTFNLKFEREAAIAIIENKVYQNVVIEIEVAPFPKDKDYKGISIFVRDSRKKKIYKNSFPKSFLYGYGDKSLQMGIENVLLQMILFKSDGQWILTIQERGIY